MPTGNDLRKNNERAVRAFEEFNQKYENKYTLVITSFFKEFQIAHLNSISNDLLFTGNISGSQMSYLFKECSGVIFPSEYEGLGMPIIETIEYNKPIACSDITVFREISKDAFIFFNPYSVPEIVTALVALVVNDPKIDNKKYNKISKKYSWKNSTHKLIESLNTPITIKPSNKYKVAVFSPNPSGNSEAGKFCLAIHTEMTRLMDLSYFQNHLLVSDIEERINYLPYITKTTNLKPGSGYNSMHYDTSIFSIDGTIESAEILFAALSNPGYVFLHDINLSATWKAMLDKGLINKNRYKIEQLMSAKLDKNNQYYVVSLLTDKHTIIVFNKQHEQTLIKYVEQLQSKPRILYYALPVSVLAYSKVIPIKTTPYLSASDLRAMYPLTDLQFNNILSKTNVLIYDINNWNDLILKAMQYGVIPCISNSLASQLEIPKGAYIEYTANMDKNKLINQFDINTESLVRQFIQKRFSYKDFVSSLLEEFNSK